MRDSMIIKRRLMEFPGGWLISNTRETENDMAATLAPLEGCLSPGYRREGPEDIAAEAK